MGRWKLRLLIEGGFCESAEVELPALLEWITMPRDLAFAWWRRAQTMTADRAGLVACGRRNKGISALAKAGIGPWLEIAVDVDALLAQAAELSHGWGRIAGLLTYVAEWEPPLIYRIQAMLDWAGEYEPAPTQPAWGSDARIAGEPSDAMPSCNSEDRSR